MKHYIFIAILTLIVSCQNTEKQEVTEKVAEIPEGISFYVGTYTEGESQGIYKYVLQNDGKLQFIKLMAQSENPSFLAKSKDGNYLLAVNERDVEGVGSVESFEIQEDTLQFINRQSSGGAHPCFVAINSAGFVLTANYTGGNVGLLRLNPNGKLNELLDIQQHTGKGTHPRQEAPHAHSAWFRTENQVIAVDLGTNELWFSELDTNTQKLKPAQTPKLAMAQNAAPRHLAFHPTDSTKLYILNELNSTVTLLNQAEKGWALDSSISTLPEGYTEQNTCADIHISSDGKFLYASNRGHNSLAIYSINAENGRLTWLAHQTKTIDTPRNFALSPDENFVLVANQKSHTISSFKRDKNTGLLEFVATINAPTPVCILF